MRRLVILVLALVPLLLEGQVLRKSGPLYSEDFGIKGDSTDETAKIQAAINYAASIKKILRFRIGIYLIGPNLKVRSNLTIEGEGDATEFKLTDGTTSPRYMFQGDDSAYTNITFRNIKINSNRQGNTGAQIWGINFQKCTKLTFDNVTFTSSKGRASLYLNQCKEVDIVNCKFRDDGSHAMQLFGGSSINILKNRFEDYAQLDSSKCAISGFVIPVTGVNIISNIFKNSKGKQFGIETAGAYMYDWNISHNYMEDDTLGGNGISGQLVNSTFSFNHMVGGVGSQRSGIELNGYGNKIIANQIDGGNIAITSSINSIDFPNSGIETTIAFNDVKTWGVNNAGIYAGGRDSVPVSGIDVLYNSVDTRLATGNSSAIFVGAYGSPGKIKNSRFIGNKIWSMGYGFRMQALSGSGDIDISDNKIYAGTYWMGHLTDSFSNVTISNNKSFLAKGDTIQYVAPATNPIIDVTNPDVFIEVADANYTIPNGFGNLTVNYYNTLTADRTVTLPDPAKNRNRKITIRNGSASFNLNLSATVYENPSTSYNTVGPGSQLTFYTNGTNFRRIQ